MKTASIYEVFFLEREREIEFEFLTEKHIYKCVKYDQLEMSTLVEAWSQTNVAAKKIII